MTETPFCGDILRGVVDDLLFSDRFERAVEKARRTPLSEHGELTVGKRVHLAPRRGDGGNIARNVQSALVASYDERARPARADDRIGLRRGEHGDGIGARELPASRVRRMQKIALFRSDEVGDHLAVRIR